MRARLWCTLISFTLALSACSSDTSTTTVPSSTTPPVQDWALVERLVVQTTDLPSGFASVPPTRAPEPVDVRTCMPSMRLTTATKLSDAFIRGGEQISSQFSVVRTASDATAIVREVDDPGVQQCLWPQLDRRLRETRTDPSSLGQLQHAPVPELGPTTTGIRTFATQEVAGTFSTAAAFDFIAVASDRSVALLFLAWPDGPPPPDLERAVVTAAKARATATFAG